MSPPPPAPPTPSPTTTQLVTVDSSSGLGSQLNTMTVARTTKCTKEEESCANRGVCDYLTGVCTCSTNFRTSDGLGNQGVRGDCGNAKGSITACPGEIACMGHGVCAGSPTYRCSCSAGYVAVAWIVPWYYKITFRLAAFSHSTSLQS